MEFVDQICGPGLTYDITSSWHPGFEVVEYENIRPDRGFGNRGTWFACLRGGFFFSYLVVGRMLCLVWMDGSCCDGLMDK